MSWFTYEAVRENDKHVFETLLRWSEYCIVLCLQDLWLYFMFIVQLVTQFTDISLQTCIYKMFQTLLIWELIILFKLLMAPPHVLPFKTLLQIWNETVRIEGQG